MKRIVFLFFLLCPCVSIMADLPEPLLSDAVISNDLSNSSDQPEREPVIKVTGNQSISKDQLEAMAYSSPSWINWQARGGGHETFEDVIGPLKENLEFALLAAGFPDATFNLSLISSPGNYGIRIELNEGQKSEFLGFEISPGLPQWLESWSEAFLGIYNESIEASLKKTSSWDCQTGEIFETHSGGSSLDFLNGKKFPSRSWFGDVDLLSPSKQVPGSTQPGFFADRAKLAKMRLIQSLKSLQKNLFSSSLRTMLERESDIQLLLGCEGARRGYPAIKVHFLPVMKKGGYFIRLKATDFETPLKFDRLKVVGMKAHSANEIENWVLNNCDLKIGQILKTSDLVKIRRRLLESCSFHDVGVRPLGLFGSCELLITLRDDPELPKLGIQFTPKQEIARKLSNLLFRKPSMVVNYRGDEIGLVLKADYRKSLFLLEFLDPESRLLGTLYLFDGYLGLSRGPEFIPVGKVALNGSLSVMSGASFNPDKDKAFNISMGIGFSSLRGPSVVHFFWTPAMSFYKYKADDYWVKDLKKDSDGWSHSSGGTDVKIVDHKEEGIRVDFEFPGFNKESESLNLSVLEKLTLPEQSLLLDCPTFSSERLVQFIRLSVEESKKKLLNNSEENNIELATITAEKIFLPKVYQLISRLIYDEEEDVSLASPPPAKIAQDKENEELRWTNLLMTVASAAISQDRRALEDKMELVLNSDHPGPVGNLVYALLGKALVSPGMARNFLLKARMINMPEDFIRDLYSLDLTDGIFDLLLEIKLNPSLRLEMESLGFDPLMLELFFDGETDDLNQMKFDKVVKLEAGIEGIKKEVSLIEKELSSTEKNQLVLSAKIKELKMMIYNNQQSLTEEKLSVVEIFVHSFWDDLIEPKMDTLMKELARNWRTSP